MAVSISRVNAFARAALWMVMVAIPSSTVSATPAARARAPQSRPASRRISAVPTWRNGGAMPGARWFPEARLNFAENLLRSRDDTDALVFWGEDKVKRRMSYGELYAEVARFQSFLRAAGVGELAQGGAGFAQLGLLLLVVEGQQQITHLDPITFPHQTLSDHTGDFAADLADRLTIDLAAGHHPLHQGPLLQAIARDFRTTPLLPGINAEQQ